MVPGGDKYQSLKTLLGGILVNILELELGNLKLSAKGADFLEAMDKSVGPGWNHPLPEPPGASVPPP